MNEFRGWLVLSFFVCVIAHRIILSGKNTTMKLANRGGTQITLIFKEERG